MSIRLSHCNIVIVWACGGFKITFLNYRPLVDSGKNPQKYIRFTAEDLEHMLGEFFEGKTVNDPKR